MTLALLVWLESTLASLQGAQLPPPEAWRRADAVTRRLDPSAFPEIPESVRVDLMRCGCRIPQAYTGGHHNVIRGSFKEPGQVDWAVLCSRDRTSSILVFWAVGAVAELARKPDADFLQVIAPGQIGFSRAIGVASPEYIRENHERYGGPQPPSLTHAGIDDAFVEKASVVWYRHRGRWLRLTGAD